MKQKVVVLLEEKKTKPGLVPSGPNNILRLFFVKTNNFLAIQPH